MLTNTVQTGGFLMWPHTHAKILRTAMNMANWRGRQAVDTITASSGCASKPVGGTLFSINNIRDRRPSFNLFTANSATRNYLFGIPVHSVNIIRGATAKQNHIIPAETSEHFQCWHFTLKWLCRWNSMSYCFDDKFCVLT